MNDYEEKVLKAFFEIGVSSVPNQLLKERSQLDEFVFADALEALEKRGFIERYIGRTVLLTRGKIHLRKSGHSSIQ